MSVAVNVIVSVGANGMKKLVRNAAVYVAGSL